MNSFVYDSAAKNLSLLKNMRVFWDYRDVIRLLVHRDLTVKYKRSLFGIGWTLLNPILTSLVLWLVFVEIFAQRFSNGTSYAPYVLSGVLILVFFQQGFNQSAEAITQGASLLTKVYVPPQVFALAGAFSNAINFIFGLFALALLSLMTGDGISTQFVLIIPMIFFMLIYITGLGLMVSILYIRFQDSRNVVSVVLLLMTYLTPVFYPKEILSGMIAKLASLNPLTSYADIFRYVFTDSGVATIGDWIYIATTSISILILGIRIFARSWPRVVVML